MEINRLGYQTTIYISDLADLCFFCSNELGRVIVEIASGTNIMHNKAMYCSICNKYYINKKRLRLNNKITIISRLNRK